MEQDSHASKQPQSTAPEAAPSAADSSAGAVFRWSELPPMPAFYKAPGTEEQEENEEAYQTRLLSRRVKKILNRVTLYLSEACVLAAVVVGVLLWKQHQPPPMLIADNIVYSPDNIVMMLVENQQQWILKKPYNGTNACCFLDLDFDGSPELVSISYDSEHILTKAKIFRVRNCQLDEIAFYDPAKIENNGFFDIGRSLSLYYAPKTSEMLYFSQNAKILDLAKTETDLGCFFLQENQICYKKYFRDVYDIGLHQYACFDESGFPQATTQLNYQMKQKALFNGLVNLHLNVEWVCVDGGLEGLSNRKLAALLLRSYDAFSYDNLSSQRKS